MPCGQSSQTFTAPVFGRRLEINHRRERLVIDLDELGCVAGLRERLGNHKGDAIADETYLVTDKQGLEGAIALGRTEIFRHEVSGKAAELLGRCIGAGQHAEHAGSSLRTGNIDACDARVRVRRKHGHPEALTGQADIVDVATSAEQETLIFHSAHRLSNAELGHVRSPRFHAVVNCARMLTESPQRRQHASYWLSQRRMKPSRPCGMKMIMAMKMTPTGMR